MFPRLSPCNPKDCKEHWHLDIDNDINHHGSAEEESQPQASSDTSSNVPKQEVDLTASGQHIESGQNSKSRSTLREPRYLMIIRNFTPS